MKSAYSTARLLAAIAMLALPVSGCAPQGQALDTPDTTPPVVNISAPTAGARLNGSSPTTIKIDISDDSGRIARVAVLVNGAPLKTLTTGPFELQWTPPAAGDYEISAEAADLAGNTSASSVITVVVVNAAAAAPKPTPAPVPTPTPGSETILPDAIPEGQTFDGFWGAWCGGSDYDSATNVEGRLKAAGAPAFKVQTWQWENLNPDTEIWTTCIGPFRTKAEAEAWLPKARSAGFPTAYVKQATGWRGGL